MTEKDKKEADISIDKSVKHYIEQKLREGCIVQKEIQNAIWSGRYKPDPNRRTMSLEDLIIEAAREEVKVLVKQLKIKASNLEIERVES